MMTAYPFLSIKSFLVLPDHSSMWLSEKSVQ